MPRLIRSSPLLAVLLAASCAPTDQTEPPEKSRAHHEALLNGTVSGAEQDSSVLVRLAAPTGISNASGVLVAPNLVLTALHVVSAFEPGSGGGDLCAVGGDGASVFTVSKASEVEVHPGPKFPGLVKPLVATAKVMPLPVVNLCDGDLAFVLLEAPLEGYPIAQMRLDTPPSVGEALYGVGWGIMDVFGAQPKQRQTLGGLSVLVVGPGDYASEGFASVPVLDGTFFTTSGMCSGDSGSGAFSASTGALVGITSAVINLDPAKKPTESEPFKNCDGAIVLLSHFAKNRSFLLDVFKAAGHAPWREGKPKPAAFGAACSEDLDCDQMVCAGNLCSRSCAAEACPDGYECADGAQGKVCVVPGGSAGSGGSGGGSGEAGGSGAAGSAIQAGAAGVGGSSGAAGVSGAQQPQGASCKEAGDCASGLCLNTPEGNLCSQRCDVSACADGWECAAVAEQKLCVPPSKAAQTPEDGGCAVSGAPGVAGFVPWWGLALAAALLRRRRG